MTDAIFNRESNEFRDKNRAIDSVGRYIHAEFEGLHPADRVDAYRAIEREAGQAATRQAETNERDGVPEHPQESATSGRLDG